MRILVTGATGLVAGRLVRLIPSAGHLLIAQSRQSGAHRTDLAQASAVDALFDQARPDLVINPSGMTDVDACERSADEAYEANVVAVRNLATACRKFGAHLVHVSTDYVFDGEDGPYTEDATPSPRGVYAKTKAEGESVARELLPGCAIARTAVVYGWPPVGGKLNFGAWLVTKLSASERVRLFSDQLVSPTWAQSAAAMLLEVAERREGGIWHLCGAEVLDRVSFGRRLCARFGFDPALIDPVLMADVTLAIPRPRRAGLLIGRARTLANAPMSVDEALKAFHAEWSQP